MTQALFQSSKKAIWALAVLLTVAGAGPAFAEGAATLGQIQGEVLIQLASSTDPESWSPAAEGASVSSGDTVKTGANGSCTLSYADQATFTLDPNSTVTVQSEPDSNDLLLRLGKLRGKVNKENVVKPFQVVTPTAVGAVRGTEVDFAFNDQSQLTIDLHNGNVLVYNDEAGMKVDLGGKKTLRVTYDRNAGVITVENDCGSDGPVSFSVLGMEYAGNPCDKQEISLQTATGEPGVPDTGGPDEPENPRESPSPEIPTELSPIE